MGILNKLEEGFDSFLEKEWVSLLMAFFGTLGLFLYMAFWFALYLIYLPLNWVWVNKIRGVSK